MKYRYFLRQYKYDIEGTVVALFSTLIPLLVESIYSLPISLLIILASLFYILFQKSKDREFYYLSLTNRKNIENWTGEGFNYKKSENCFLIEDADPGVIFSSTLSWSDYSFKFKFKIESYCVGIIVRAVNLSNYVMLQIRNDCIRPHVRVNGSWSIWEPATTGFKFSNNLSCDKWYCGEIKCENNSITIIIQDNKNIVFNRLWKIPKGAVLFEYKDENDLQGKDHIKIPFSINLEYGAVGFRNSHNEIALIKEVLIEKINK